MDMVQVKDLDDHVRELVEKSNWPNNLRLIRELAIGWQEYEPSQDHTSILQAFRDRDGRSVVGKLKPHMKDLVVHEKFPFRLLSGKDVFVESGSLWVLIPLSYSSTCVKYKTRASREWNHLRWEPGTYILVPWGNKLRVEAPGMSVSGLMVEIKSQ
ncbi:hypothetical protein NCS52_01544000 [Fusarium sp. LHS14.1]|nr:hypothetical protein NCS52_01544000 [Fusarium sp. LHS14.1]